MRNGWIMRQVLGVEGCTQVSEIGDDSPTGIEASQYFNTQHGCTTASSINCWGGSCSSPGFPWRVTGVGVDAVTLQHTMWLLLWGQSPTLLSEPWAEVLESLGIPHSGLLKTRWLQSPSSQAPSRGSLGQVLQAGTKRLLCKMGLGVSLWVWWRGMFSVHRCHTTQEVPPLYGVQDKKKRLFFFMYPLISRISLATTWNSWSEPRCFGCIQKRSLCIVSWSTLFY